jgi:hypothetical protein
MEFGVQSTAVQRRTKKGLSLDRSIVCVAMAIDRDLGDAGGDRPWGAAAGVRAGAVVVRRGGDAALRAQLLVEAPDELVGLPVHLLLRAAAGLVAVARGERRVGGAAAMPARRRRGGAVGVVGAGRRPQRRRLGGGRRHGHGGVVVVEEVLAVVEHLEHPGDVGRVVAVVVVTASAGAGVVGEPVVVAAVVEEGVLLQLNSTSRRRPREGSYTASAGSMPRHDSDDDPAAAAEAEKPCPWLWWWWWNVTRWPSALPAILPRRRRRWRSMASLRPDGACSPRRSMYSTARTTRHSRRATPGSAATTLPPPTSAMGERSVCVCQWVGLKDLKWLVGVGGGAGI